MNAYDNQEEKKVLSAAANFEECMFQQNVL